ncbi:MAG: hypothetical protein IPP77_11945 [Bacteroidetes bacterium]|nr:hypothetical protein [Bacteroidota bacterium]
MKKSITNCPPWTDIFKDVSSSLKTATMLILLVGLGLFSNAQTPACNIGGNLEACAVRPSSDERADILVPILIAQSGNNPTLIYDLPVGDNFTGAFIRSDATGKYYPGTNSFRDTLVIFPGTGPGGFLLTLLVTNIESGKQNSCSKSVTVFNVDVTSSHTPILCYGEKSILTALGTSDPLKPITYSIVPGGASNGTGIFPGLSGSAGGIIYTTTASVDILTLTGTAECTASVNDTIKEPVSKPIIINCPGNSDQPTCLTQAEINTQFALWKDQFGFSGGTSPVAQTDLSEFSAPNYCGGHTTITYKVKDLVCDSVKECTSTFTVPESPKVTVSCSQSVSLAGCTTREAIDAAYATWKAGFTKDGGCHTYDNLDQIPTLPQTILCGDSIGFTYIAQNGQGYCPGRDECFSYFKVGATENPVVSCSQSVNLSGCTTQEAIDAAYATWKAGFTFNNTGCHAFDNSADIPSLPENILCGDSIGFTYIAQNGQGYCAGRDVCFSYFKVGTTDKPVVSCSQSVNLSGCTTQEAIAAAYATWKAGFTFNNTGCHATDNKADVPSLPENILCGDSIGFTYVAQNGEGYCAGSDECFSYFKVGTTDKPVVSCSQSVNLSGCTTQEAIAAAYATWKAGFTFNNTGCHATDNKADVPSLPENILCGDSIGFTLCCSERRRLLRW